MFIPSLLIVTTSLFAGSDPGSSKDDKPVVRKPNPWARSLPMLTRDEEKQLDETIDRFIDFDLGKLTGDEGKKAKAEFDKLGPDATFALIRGLNRAAKIEGSCPALIIGKKLNNILSATEDRDLLDFARDNVGAGVKQTVHASVLADLRTLCLLRKNALVRAGVPNPPAYGSTVSSSPTKLSVAELVNTASTAKTSQAKQAVAELVARTGDNATIINALASVSATVSDDEVKQSARSALEKCLARLSQADLKVRLKDKQIETRAAAARVVGSKRYKLGSELIDLLDDDSNVVSDSAHQALLRLAGGKTDFGPDPKSDATARAEAVKKWRAWWATQKH